MHDALTLLDLPPTAALPIRCPRARAVTTEEDGPSVLCTVIQAANEREALADEVPPLVSGRSSAGAIIMFCCGQGVPGPPVTTADVEAINGRMSAREAHETFCYTDCPTFVDELERLERVKREGAVAKLQTSGAIRRD